MTYSSLEEIESRKTKLKDDIQQQSGQISTLWRGLTYPQPASSKGEMISNSITAIDAFLLVRKLIRNYGLLFGRKKRK